jgi:hypothetical protein
VSKFAPITKADRWFRGERKNIMYDIDNGATPALPVDVSTFGLRWRLQAGNGDDAQVYLEKTQGAGISVVNSGKPGGTNDRAVVALGPADYADVPSAGRGSSFYAVLWRTDGDNDVVLAEGPAFLGEAGTGA